MAGAGVKINSSWLRNEAVTWTRASVETDKGGFICHKCLMWLRGLSGGQCQCQMLGHFPNIQPVAHN